MMIDINEDRYNRLSSIPTDTGLGSNSTGSNALRETITPPIISGGNQTSNENPSFFRDFTWKTLLAVLVSSGALIWFISNTSNVAAEISENKTEIKNLKERLDRTDKDQEKEINNLQKQIDNFNQPYTSTENSELK